MPHPPSEDSPIDRSKRPRFEINTWDSDDVEVGHDDRHSKRQAIHDPKRRTPYLNTKVSKKFRRKKGISIKEEQNDKHPKRQTLRDTKRRTPYFNTEKSKNPCRKKEMPVKEEQDVANGSMTLRSVLSENDAGVIIGRGGRSVHNIRDKSTADVTISPKDQDEHERFMTVYGSIHSISMAFGLIGERLLTESTLEHDDKNTDRSTVSIRLLIPDSQIGILMGKGGATIKLIQEQSFARVDAERAKSSPLPMSNDRTVTLYGTPFSIQQAVYLIVEILLRETKDQERVQHIPSATNRAKSNNDNNNNGDNKKASSGSGSRQSHVSIGQHAAMMGYGGIMPMGAVPMNMNMNMNMAMNMGMGQFYYPNNPIMHAITRQSIPVTTTSQTQRIYVPNELVGSIIGKQGSTINEIRQVSGSEIKIESPNDTKERLITIMGSPEGNQVALCLLYSKIEAEKIKLGIP